MNDTALILFGGVFALTIGTLVLCSLAYFFYRFGVKLSTVLPRHMRLTTAIAVMSIGFFPASMVGFLFPVHPIVKISIAIAILVFQLNPCAIGFAAGRHFDQEEERKRFKQNVDLWTAEWECRDDDESEAADLDFRENPPES